MEKQGDLEVKQQKRSISNAATTIQLSSSPPYNASSPFTIHIGDKKIEVQAEIISSPVQQEGLKNVHLLAYISIQLIQTIENNNTRQCRYLIFHIPFTYMLCDTLQLLNCKQDLYLYSILSQQIKILAFFNSKQQSQLPKEQIMKAMMDAVNLKKMSKDFFLNQLSLFLQKYAVKMSTFIPYYYYLFELVSQRKKYLTEQTNLSTVRDLMKEKIEWIRKRFHNYEIQ